MGAEEDIDSGGRKVELCGLRRKKEIENDG